MEPRRPEQSIRDRIAAAYQDGTFLQAVYEMALADRGEWNVLSAELAALHNEGVIDVVAGFSSLDIVSGGPDFFLTRRVFEKALPQIDAPVAQVMKCVLVLCERAGKDLAAGTIVNSFIDFCARDPSRPETALAAIREDAALLDLLNATIVAGARLDCPRYAAEAVSLSGHADIGVRRKAIYALGRIVWPAEFTPPEAVYAALEGRVEAEDDDELLACAARSGFAVLQRDPRQTKRLLDLMDKALQKGGDYAIHAASEIAFFHTKELTSELVDMLVPHMLRVKPENKGTLDNIDYFLEHLVRQGNSDRAVEIIERLLLEHSDELSLDVFDSVSAEILRNKALLNRVTTRWFLQAEPALCEGITSMATKVFGSDLRIEADANELAPATHGRLIFLARKAIAYLFFSPVSATCFFISLMRLAESDETLDELGNHLFDHLLVNYSGKAREYVTEVMNSEGERVRKQLERSLALLDGYIEGLRSVEDIPEFNPSAAQREVHYRRLARQMAESYKQAEARSPLLSIMSKSVLLYGRKSINYVYGQQGERHRMEIPLKSHSVTFESPRKEQLDPFGLEYTIRVFRAERLRE